MRNKSNIYTHLILATFTLVFLTQISYPQNPVDTGFNTFPSRDMSDTSANRNAEIVLQPDGKLLLSGDFRVMNGKAVNRVVRINNDGTIDDTFNCVACNTVSVNSILLQDDGKVVVAGSRTTAQSEFGNPSRMIRVNSDGSLDSSFSTPYTDEQPNSTYYSATILGKQSDGKLFVGRRFSFLNGSSLIRVNRLNTNGSFDSSFQQFTTITFSGTTVRGSVNGMEQLPNGKIYVYGATNFGTIARLNADGTEDETYNKPSFTNQPTIPPYIYDIKIQADGKVVLVGFFFSVNGVSKLHFARLNLDGSVDLTFTDATGIYGSPVEKFSDGSLLVREAPQFSNNYLPKKLTSNGDPNGTFNFPKDFTRVLNYVVEPVTDKMYVFGALNNSAGRLVFKFARLNTDGSLDPNFINEIGFGAVVRDLAIQSDQKTIMVGLFDWVNGTPQKNIARVNIDGTLDETFNPSTDARQAPNNVFISPNGEIYLDGRFNNNSGIARLNSDGSIDNTFNLTHSGGLKTMAFQSDGKILIGGHFNNVNGQTVSKAVRLNNDGTLDTSFMPDLGTNSDPINKIVIQPDGKIVLGGSVVFEGDTNRRYLGRYNADGSFDQSLNYGLDNTVKDFDQLPNGQFLVSTGQLQRLNNDGSIDESYSSPTFDYLLDCPHNCELELKLLPDQSIIAYGNFINVNGLESQYSLTRVLSDGTLSDTSYPQTTNGIVYDIEFQNDNKMVIGGGFNEVQTISRPGIARLELPDLTQTIDYDFDGDGKADIAVFRPTENKWYVLRSSDFGVTQQVFGIGGDSPTPADHDGDGIADYAIYRNMQGDWWSLSSVAGNQVFAHLGQNGDVPRPSDFDGDGRADYVVYRPTDFTWYRASSANGAVSNKQFGAAGDKPLVGDFDGDGKSDVAIYRPSTGDWWWQSSIDIQRATHWGIATDIPTPGDYDGDGITDFAVYRPADGVWYVLNSSSGNTAATIIQFGIAEDKPVPADYDGDGKTDIAVYRPSTGVWYLLKSTQGFQAIQFGISSDVPIPNALIP